MNLRELNYILIPKASASWDRWEQSRTGRILQPFLDVLGSATTEGQVLFVAMLISGAAGIDVRFSHLYLVFSGLFGLLVAALLLRPLAFVGADELSVAVEHPARVVSGEPLTLTLVLRNTGRRSLYALRASGPFLPWDGSYLSARPAVQVLEPGREARVSLQARFLVRGQRSLGPFAVGSIRPLGLARGNRRRTSPLRFTVLPRLVPVAEMPLPPWRHAAYGSPQAQTSGESFELLGVRPYRPGDRPRDLHARASARHGEPIVRELRQEVFRRAGVIVDLSGDAKREVVDASLGLAGGMVEWLAARQVVVDLCVIGRRLSQVTVGERVGPVDAAWELLALVEPGEPVEGDPGQFPTERWSACHVVVAHAARTSAYDRAATLRGRHFAVQVVAVVDRARAPAPPAERVLEERALRPGSAGAGLVL